MPSVQWHYMMSTMIAAASVSGVCFCISSHHPSYRADRSLLQRPIREPLGNLPVYCGLAGLGTPSLFTRSCKSWQRLPRCLFCGSNSSMIKGKHCHFANLDVRGNRVLHILNMRQTYSVCQVGADTDLQTQESPAIQRVFNLGTVTICHDKTRFC